MRYVMATLATISCSLLGVILLWLSGYNFDHRSFGLAHFSFAWLVISVGVGVFVHEEWGEP